MEERLLNQQDAVALMEFWKNNFAQDVISTNSFLMIQSKLEDKNYNDLMQEKSIELRSIASQCGLDANELIDDISDSVEIANKTSTNFSDIKDQYVQWWYIFLFQWNAKCFLKWVAKCKDSMDYGNMQNLWFDYIESLWLVGCDIAKFSQRLEPIPENRKEAFGKWFQIIDETVFEMTNIFKEKQRQAITNFLQDLRKFDNSSIQEKLEYLLAQISN